MQNLGRLWTEVEDIAGESVLGHLGCMALMKVFLGRRRAQGLQGAIPGLAMSTTAQDLRQNRTQDR